MGAYNSAQAADLLCFYILDTLSIFVDLKLAGLYRDDGLSSIPNRNGPQNANLQKIKQKQNIITPFKLLGFKIESFSNFKVVHYLDTTLNINDKTFKT